MKRRKRVHIVSRKVPASACPNCFAVLSGFTFADLDGGASEPPPLKGNATMCAYCGAMLIFADDAGSVRTMTAAERESIRFSPEVEKLYKGWVAEKIRPGDFTKRSFN